MKEKEIKIPIYNDTLIISQSDSLKEVENKYDLTDTSGYDAITFKMNGVIHVAFEGNPKTSIIVHESVHITNYIFELSNIDPDLHNDEPQAYLLQWVFEECFNFIHNKK